MRRASHIHPESNEERHVREFDLRETDSSPASFWTRKYLARFGEVVETVKRLLPQGSTILDLACAQGNVAIIASELGYRCLGIDLRSGFLRYAKKKEEAPEVLWIVADATRAPIRLASVDAVILGEIVEHVAEPDRLIRTALDLVRPGGFLIITTPNGTCLRHRRLPSYQIAAKNLELLRLRQFGPAA